MAWADARDELVAVLEAVTGVDRVLRAPPTTSAALRGGTGVVVVLAPPARSTQRRHGETRRIFQQRIQVMRPAGPYAEHATHQVDVAIERITDAMEDAVTLGGYATITGSPQWGDTAAVEHPPGSGLWFVAAVATVEVVLVEPATRAA